jgi:hypothetical protein
VDVEWRVGDPELDPAEVVVRSTNDDLVVIRGQVGGDLSDGPPLSGGAGAWTHDLVLRGDACRQQQFQCGCDERCLHPSVFQHGDPCL